MKTIRFFTLALASLSMGSFASTVSVNEAQLTRVLEIPLEHVFVARAGFDDNDNVQAVVEGMLPNSCYALGNTEFSIVPGSNKLVITQKAIHDESGVCANEDTLPPSLKQGIPFWRELNIGVLDIGTYRIIYSSENGVSSRDFSVEAAPTTNVDSLRYAIVTNAFAPEGMTTAQDEIEFRVTGYLTSSCAELSSETRVEKVDDIYVFLPSVKVSEDICMPANKPFYKVIRVPTPKAGRYLLHVRSQAGQSRNSPFRVTDE